MIDISPWLVAIFSSKLLLYIAFSMSLGGVSAMLTMQNYKPHSMPFIHYATLGALLGVIVASLDFFLQVGSFADEGIVGMLDKTYIEVLWQSGVGQSYQLRLLGWGGILLLLLGLRLAPLFARSISIFCLLLSVAVASSFTLVGHNAEQALWVRLALVLHIIVAMWWIGMLYPLRHWCTELPSNTLKGFMHQFGVQASFLVGLLLVAGVAISYILEDSFANLINSLHGNVLLLKVTSVGAILSLAAIHKLRLVPSLESDDSVLKLKHSIGIEMGIALLILVITAVLSTLVGPSNM